MSNEGNTSAYAVPIPPATTPWPAEYGPMVPVYGCPTPAIHSEDILRRLGELHKNTDSARLDRIEAKLDELLKRTAPEAAQVEEIRRRVREALGEKT